MPEWKYSLRSVGRLVFFCSLLLFSLAACGGNAGTGGSNAGTGGSAGTASGNISTPTSSAGSATPATATGGTLTVTGVDMAVNPASVSSYACGATLTVTYTATFHFPANNAGGQVVFQYTTNNGRAGTPADLTVAPGQTSVPYQFTWSGALPVDHTRPEPGGVVVSSPNAFTSSLLGPSGNCSTASTTAFQVTSVAVTASPTVAQACNTAFTETYKAVFHIAPNSPGGTIVFAYSLNNGRSNSQNISLHVLANQTTITYKFYWTGVLFADHTVPGVGIILVSAPNQVTSTGGVPTGQCS